jgi:thioredoxin reductase (NADPH)
MSNSDFDLLIAGVGPAGLTASLFARRLGLTAIAFGDIPGGNMYMIENLTNFPGFPEGVPGTEFGLKLFQQAQNEGAVFPMTQLKQLARTEKGFLGVDAGDQEYTADSAVVAAGRTPVRPPDFRADIQGVHFCSVCNGPLYRNKGATLAVVGSDNAAAQHAMTLSRTADKVHLLFRSQHSLMDAAHWNLLTQKDNIDIHPQLEAVGLKGGNLIEALEVASAQGGETEMTVDAVFLAIGWRPNTDFLAFEVEVSDAGYLMTNNKLMTSQPGLFAAGDVREKELRQVLTACADGALAARGAEAFLSERVGTGS